MTRTAARELAVHLAFELGFSNETAQALLERTLTEECFQSRGEECMLYNEMPDEKQTAYLTRIITGVSEHGYELDGYIEKYAIGWAFDRIPRVAAAVMRVAMFECMYLPHEIPVASAINAAVEIAKRYEDDKVVGFLNGVLGSFVRQELGVQR